MSDLDGRKVAFLVANEGVEQVELTEPWRAVERAGGQPVLIAPSGGRVQAFHHLDRGDAFPVDVSIAHAVPDAFLGLVLPGGVANADQLRTCTDAVAFARCFAAAGRPIAVICHGPWTLVEAGVVRGRTLTSWPSLRTDIENAGGHWVDRPVQVCTRSEASIVSSRKPDDLSAFCRQFVATFARSAGSRSLQERERT